MLHSEFSYYPSSFHCEWYRFFGKNIYPLLGLSTARDFPLLQMVIMFVCFIVYNESTAVTEKCCWFTEQHGFRGNSTICVQ